MSYRRCPLCAHHWYDPTVWGPAGVACAVCAGHLVALTVGCPLLCWWIYPLAIGQRIYHGPRSTYGFDREPYHLAILDRPIPPHWGQWHVLWSATFTGPLWVATHGAWPGIIQEPQWTPF